MRIRADRSVCNGSGNCVLVAADVFGQDEDAVVVLRIDTPPAAQPWGSSGCILHPLPV